MLGRWVFRVERTLVATSTGKPVIAMTDEIGGVTLTPRPETNTFTVAVGAASVEIDHHQGLRLWDWLTAVLDAVSPSSTTLTRRELDQDLLDTMRGYCARLERRLGQDPSA